ncbi:MAG: hypothetical protein FWC38_02950 [Proteobacteria bacterium]|nr:hypothetical protein [Pseudomonadota bacterium]MCL2307194.1 hypothetical protein [Pseudomonadota bacterium]
MNKLDEKIREEVTRLENERDTETLRDVLGIVGISDDRPRVPARDDLYLDDPEDF